jgi:hypothetical protein
MRRWRLVAKVSLAYAKGVSIGAKAGKRTPWRIDRVPRAQRMLVDQSTMFAERITRRS